MQIAAERIRALESLAATAVRQSELDLSREYVRLARRIAERQRLSIPRHFKRRMCPGCDVYQIVGINARVRLQNGHVVITCDCGEHARYPYTG